MKTPLRLCVMFWLLACQLPVFGQGNTLVKDIVPGSSGVVPGDFVKAGNKLFFVRRTTGPRELYKTDGTAAGTQLVKTWTKDSDPYDPYQARNAVDFNGRMVFTRYNEATTNQHEIWVSDGTTAGTRNIAAPTSASSYRIEQLTVFNNALYFAIEGYATIRGLYKWDGSTSAPVRIVGEALATAALDYSIIVGDNKLFFSDSWKVFDVTNTPTVLYDQGQIPGSNTGLSTIVYHNGKLLLTEGRLIEGGGYKGIRALDPVTKQYPFIKQEIGFGLPLPSNLGPNLAKMGGSIYFGRSRSSGTITAPVTNYELWKIDPAFQVTIVKSIAYPGSVNSRIFMANSNLLVFSLHMSVTNASEHELWKSDGTAAGTVPFIERSDRIQFPGDQKAFFLSNTKLFFPASDRTETYPNTAHGQELWVSNFTKAGTRLAVDFTVGSQGGVYDTGFGSLDGTSIFLAANRRTPTTNLYGADLWKSDGTPIAENGQVPAVPTISTVAPASGPWGSTIVISGTNLTGATAVKFNQTNTTAHIVNSATQITVVVPDGATTGRISVTTPGGMAISPADFTIIQAPTITAFAPANTTIGATVNITGTNFLGATAVKFNTMPAGSYTVVSATSITATVPPGATTGKISVTTPGGTGESATNIIIAPVTTITDFSPVSGPVGTAVTITGTNLSGVSVVKFNTATATSVTINSATSLTATVPPGATTGKISVTTPTGTVVSTATFTVVTAQPATISAFSPATGPVGTLVTLTGTNFSGASVVKFNTTTAPSFTVVSATSLTATVPAGATTGKISVTTPGGTVQSGASFTVSAPPTGGPFLSSFAPGSGAPGAVITLTGTNFTGARDVSFGGKPSLGFTVTSATTISVIVPQTAASGKITVTTPSATHQSVSDFTVVIPTSALASGPVAGVSLNTSNTPFTLLKNHFYFSRSQAGKNQLWRSNGTASGTISVSSEIRTPVNVEYARASEKYIYFFERDILSKTRLVALDENLVKQELSTPTSINDTYTLLNNKAIFEKDLDIWAFDEVTNTSTRLLDFSPHQLVAYKGLAYFNGNPGSGGYGIGRTDGTAAGSFLVSGSTTLYANLFGGAGDYMYIACSEPATSGWVLYRTTGAAPNSLTRISGFNGDIRNLTDVNGTLFFTGRASTSSVGWEIYKVTNTTVELVKDVYPGAGNGTRDLVKPAAIGNTLYFSGENDKGVELWKSDGTAAGTVLVKDLNPDYGDAYPDYLTAVGNKVYFSGGRSYSDMKLHVSDGTVAGTQAVTFAAGGILYMTYFRGNLVMSANNAATNLRELHIYNLGSAGLPTPTAQRAGPNNFKVYPNPSTDFITIQPANTQADWVVSIFNQVGQKLEELTFKTNTARQVDLRKYPAGMYVLRIFDGQDYYSKKIVKQ